MLPKHSFAPLHRPFSVLSVNIPANEQHSKAGILRATVVSATSTQLTLRFVLIQAMVTRSLCSKPILKLRIQRVLDLPIVNAESLLPLGIANTLHSNTSNVPRKRPASFPYSYPSNSSDMNINISPHSPRSPPRPSRKPFGPRSARPQSINQSRNPGTHEAVSSGAGALADPHSRAK